MQSLADYLGTAPQKAEEGPALQVYEFSPSSAKEFAAAVLDSREFRNYIINGLILGELPPAITMRLMDYAWGKPVERLEIDDRRSQFESLSKTELEEQIVLMQELVQELPDDVSKTSVH